LIPSGANTFFALAQSSTESNSSLFHAIVVKHANDTLLSWGFNQLRSKHFDNFIRSLVGRRIPLLQSAPAKFIYILHFMVRTSRIITIQGLLHDETGQIIILFVPFVSPSEGWYGAQLNTSTERFSAFTNVILFGANNATQRPGLCRAGEKQDYGTFVIRSISIS